MVEGGGDESVRAVVYEDGEKPGAVHLYGWPELKPEFHFQRVSIFS